MRTARFLSTAFISNKHAALTADESLYFVETQAVTLCKKPEARYQRAILRYSRSRDSSVGIVTSYWLGSSNFSLLPSVQTGTGVHPASYSTGTAGKRPEACSRSHPVQRHSHTCLHCIHRDNLLESTRTVRKVSGHFEYLEKPVAWPCCNTAACPRRPYCASVNSHYSVGLVSRQ